MSKLMIVDDEKMIQDSLSRYISQLLPDFKICGCFYNGEDALHYMLKHPADVDIVLTDICMPHMDGLELARELCNRFPHCVVIIISGYAEFEYAKSAIKYNVFNYMMKPFDYGSLGQCLLEARDLAVKRRQFYSIFNLSAETTELFFDDLISGSISSVKMLQEKFDTLSLPFSFDHNGGYLVRFTIEKDQKASDLHFDTEQLHVSLKNMLHLFLSDAHFYFVRKSGLDYDYLAVNNDTDIYLPSGQQSEQIALNIKELLDIQCTVSFCHPFHSLKDFIPGKETHFAKRPEPDIMTDSQIQHAIDYINANYHTDITRDIVSDLVFLSPSYFSYQFKQITGTSFIDYLTTVRMQNAIELLKTNIPITDIAFKVGYSHKNRFNVNFRHFTSYSPTEYRKKMLSMGDVFDA